MNKSFTHAYYLIFKKRAYLGMFSFMKDNKMCKILIVNDPMTINNLFHKDVRQPNLRIICALNVNFKNNSPTIA